MEFGMEIPYNKMNYLFTHFFLMMSPFWLIVFKCFFYMVAKKSYREKYFRIEE